MTDAKSTEEMKAIIKRVSDRMERDHVGLYEAIKRENIPKTTYYSYRDRLEMQERMMQPHEQIPEYPRPRQEDLIMPPKQKHKQATKRINIDVPTEIYDYIEKEHQESTLSIKGICQKIIIDYVSDKRNKGEKLFRM
jgi:nicotinic acid mononucleotide adenylyltransferase